MKVYFCKAKYGRQEMTMKCLVAAINPNQCRKIANAAAPVPTPENDIAVALVEDLVYEGRDPCVILKL